MIWNCTVVITKLCKDPGSLPVLAVNIGAGMSE
jgi:hypothetical protein